MESVESSVLPVWPKLNDLALHGLAGDIVRELDLYTEADRVAVLAHTLAQYACYTGSPPRPSVELGGMMSPLLINPVLVGPTAKGRKGTAAKESESIFERACPSWSKRQLRGSLSTGEGLVYAVRDPGMIDGEPDEGVTDKRLYLVQPEFGIMLKVMGREGNSLSGTIRDAWDGNDLAPLTKNCRVRATNPHIIIVGHVTQEEIVKELKAIEQCNGFGNRFVWLAVRRSKLLPFPPPRDEARMDILAARLREAGCFAQNVRSVTWSEEGKKAWIEVYPSLSEGEPGSVGALLGRAEAQVGRLAALYALLDLSAVIDAPHLQAALSLWEYSRQSVQWIFGNGVVNEAMENKLLRKLVHQGKLTDSEIHTVFGRNQSTDVLNALKRSLKAQKLAHDVTEQTEGRPRQVWKPGPARRIAE